MKLSPLSSLALAFCLVFATAAPAAPYDPLALPQKAPAIAGVDFTVHDATRDRDIPVRVFLPAASAMAAPVVLFSPGLGGSREGSAYLGEHWAGRGYAVVYLQHQGSDDAVWKNAEPAKRMEAMKQAASVQNFLLRAQDVHAVLDQLALWNKETGHALAGRLDLGHVGMAGHSFGAITTQAVSGQAFPSAGGQRFTDPRIRAAVAFSPSPSKSSGVQESFGEVKIPWMLMTGTKDTSPISAATVEARESVYPSLPPGDKYELVLDKAEHSAFTDRQLPGDTEPRNPNHHKAILALTTAFWDAYLKDNAEAKTWLQGEGPRGLLEKDDRWQKK
jgi:predicted dienelactone hydrolase